MMNSIGRLDTPRALAAFADWTDRIAAGALPKTNPPRPLDGRIDDAGAGWKSRGLWSLYSDRSTAHIEGGKGETSKVVHFQLRPDPLAL
jgi:hypothetical protein